MSTLKLTAVTAILAASLVSPLAAQSAVTPPFHAGQ